MHEDQPAFYTIEEATAKKKEFAAALMRNLSDPEKAAREVESRLTHVSFILQNWQYDIEVNNFMKEIRDGAGFVSTLPTKEQFAGAVYREGLGIRAPDIKLDYMKLFAQVMGYVEKGGVSVTNNNVITQRNVLVLPEQKPAKELEARAIAMQQKLINHEHG